MKTTSFIASVFAFCSLSLAHAEFRPHPELLHGYSVGGTGIVFQVSSGGCTEKESFRPVVRNASAAQVTLYRVIPDYCLALFPDGYAIYYSYRELGLSRGAPIRIMNPIRPPMR